jgi:hypothetical protein
MPPVVAHTAPRHQLLNTVHAVSKGSLPREVLDNLRRFPHCILLTRVGKFYEVTVRDSLAATS